MTENSWDTLLTETEIEDQTLSHLVAYVDGAAGAPSAASPGTYSKGASLSQMKRLGAPAHQEVNRRPLVGLAPHTAGGSLP